MMKISVQDGKKLLEEKEFEKAFAIFEELLENKLAIRTLNAWAEDVNSIGDSLYKKKNYKEALVYYEQSIELMERAGNSRKMDNYSKELMNTTEKLAQQINDEADSLLRSKKYAEAVDLYFKSVEMMSKVGKDRKINNFKDELRTALIRLAESLLKQAETSVKQGEDKKALDLIDESIIRVKMTYDEGAITKLHGKSYKVYEKIADSVNKKGDEAFKKKAWVGAIELYNESIRLVKKSKNEKKLANFQKELKKAFAQNAAEINKEGDKLYKEGKYELAIEIYRESVEAAKAGENQKLADNFQAELEKSFEKLAAEINTRGDKLFKEKKYKEAAHNYIRSISLAEDAKKQKLVQNFTKELRSTYEKWAAVLINDAKDLVKKDNFPLAVDKLEAAIEKMEITGDERKIKKAKESLIDCYESWAQDVNAEGDTAFKLKDYEKAYNFYETSVELAEKAQNAKLLKKYRKERDRAMRKM